MEKVNYISKKEFLREIHNSKNSFCSFLDDQYSEYHVIVQDKNQITDELIQEVIAAKAKPKGKATPVILQPNEVVIRLMTHEHIPLDPDRKRKARNTDQSYARTNFPPFKHFIKLDGELKEVGRSHWKGGFDNGEFCLDQGKINNKLAVMFMLLVERIASRGNWRGYCVDRTTEALTKRGWLTYDEITTEDEILSYKDGQLTWSAIKSIYRGHYDGLMFGMKVSGLDALVTPGHKWVTEHGLKEVEMLLETDNVILGGEAEEGPTKATYTDDFVELVGWTLTEGSIYRCAGRNYDRFAIYQNEGEKADRIRACLTNLGARFSEYHRKTTKNVCFNLTKDTCQKLSDVIVTEGKVPTMDFLLALTADQRKLLIATMVDGDGFRTKEGLSRYYQKSKAHIDAFAILCTLVGLRVSIKELAGTSFGKEVSGYIATIFSDRVKHSRVENIDLFGGKRNGAIKGRGKHNHPNEPTIPYNDVVWCPETEFGSFVARRNGCIYLTGNSYVDEMRGHALAQLSQVGLTFDESKSDNPFAFYTTAVNHSFTRVLNLERRSQNIRDDMLIMVGSAPSITRQVENEMQYRFPQKEGEAPPPKTKKRSPKESKITFKDD